MKIAYLTNQYPKISHTFIRREINGLESLGVEVVRLSLRRTKEVLVDEEDHTENAKTVFILETPAYKTAIRLAVATLSCVALLPKAAKLLTSLIRTGQESTLKYFIYLAEACWLLKFCRARQITHLHVHFGTNPTTVAMLCKCLGGPEYSFTAHGPDEFDAPISHALGEKVRRAKFAVGISSFGKSQLYRWSDFADWHKIIEVHCTIDQKMLTRPIKPITCNNRLICIGRLAPQKGHWLLLQAVAQIKDQYPHLKVCFVGDGEYRPVFEAFIRTNDLANNIEILGWKSAEEIIEELDNASALVLPSFAEGLPVVIMEAFARCRPAICTHIAGIPELVTHENGWLLPAGDVDALAQTMAQVLQCDLETLNQKGQAGQRAVAERHSAHIEAPKIYRAIQG
jgi:colanic acid/amylovoran biosynthesis glycosyltransferase